MRISDWSSDVCSSDLWGPWRSTRWQATRESNPLRIMFGHQGILFFIDSFGFLDLASRDSSALVWICGEECVIFVFLGRTCCYVIIQEHPRNRRFNVVGCLDNVVTRLRESLMEFISEFLVFGRS